MSRTTVPLVLVVVLMVAVNTDQKRMANEICTDEETCAFPNAGDDNATALSTIASGISVSWQRFDNSDAFPGENIYTWTQPESFGWAEDNDDNDDGDAIIPSPELCQKACLRMGLTGFTWYSGSCYFRSHMANQLVDHRVSMEGAVLYVRRIVSTPAPGAYSSPHRLAVSEAGGNQFAADGTAKSTAKKNRFLVFASVGNRCLKAVKNAWLSDPNVKIFDLVLVFYAATARNAVFLELLQYARSIPGINVHVRKGYKWPNFRWWLLESSRDMLQYYSHIWVADDDLLMDTRTINRMFLTLAANPAIQIASPAFSSDSAGLWRFHDRHNPHFILRYTNFVECLGPVLSRAVLHNELFRRCLKATRTGYYLDSAFYPITGSNMRGMAILDMAVCTHPERPEVEKEMYKELADHEHGQDYKFFDQNGIAREVFWFREPEYFGGQRLPHISRHVTDQTLGLPPVEIHNSMLRTMFPTRFGPNAVLRPEEESFSVPFPVRNEL